MIWEIAKKEFSAELNYCFVDDCFHAYSCGGLPAEIGDIQQKRYRK